MSDRLLGTLIERWRNVESYSPASPERRGFINAALMCANELEAALKALPPAPPQEQEPTVSVAGSFQRSFADFERSCLVYLEEEQRRANPDNALIALLCDAVRLSREQVAPTLAASPPAQEQGWEHQHDNEACHFPGGDADCDNPNHWWISKASLSALPPAHGWHAEKEQP